MDQEDKLELDNENFLEENFNDEGINKISLFSLFSIIFLKYFYMSFLVHLIFY